MAAGDHLFVAYGLYTHHGIDLGDGTVVASSRTSGMVTRIPFAEFRDGRQVMVRQYEQSDTARVVVTRAVQRVGETGYGLWNNNCEHFATWCKTGRHESTQVQAVDHRLKVITTKAVAKGSAKVLPKIGTKLSVGVLAKTATPWLLVADVGQALVEATAGCQGKDPQEAKQIGRSAGALASIGIGAAVGGPVGGAIGLGFWLFGEVAGSVV